MQDHRGSLPPALGWMPDADRKWGVGDNWDNPAYGNPFFFLLPYVEQDSLYKRFETNFAGHKVQAPWADGCRAMMVHTYSHRCDPTLPKDGITDDGWATASYAFNAQVFAKTDKDGHIISWNGNSRIPLSFDDGTSNTILCAQKVARCGGAGALWAYWNEDPWLPAFAVWTIGPESIFQTQPAYATADCDPTRASTFFKAGIMVGMADGSSRLVSPHVSAKTWWAACTPAGRDTLGPEW